MKPNEHLQQQRESMRNAHMTFIELTRCTLACWLDRQKDRLGNLITLVEPTSEVWERYDEWCRKRGKYDWIVND